MGCWIRGQQAPPHQLGGLGSAISSPARFGTEPRPPKGFHCFQHCSMASPDTIILLIVDYHAAIGGQNPRAPPCVCPCFQQWCGLRPSVLGQDRSQSKKSVLVLVLHVVVPVLVCRSGVVLWNTVTTNIPAPSFFTGRMPSCRPTYSVIALTGKSFLWQ